MKYIYLCNHRPPQSGAVPKEGLLCCENDGVGRYGEVVYSRPLSIEEMDTYELIPYVSDKFKYATPETVADQIIGGQRALLDTTSEYPFIEFFVGFDEKGELGLTASEAEMQIHYPVEIYNKYITKHYKKDNEDEFMEKFEILERKFEDKTNSKFMHICKAIADEINTQLEDYWA